MARVTLCTRASSLLPLLTAAMSLRFFESSAPLQAASAGKAALSNPGAGPGCAPDPMPKPERQLGQGGESAGPPLMLEPCAECSSSQCCWAPLLKALTRQLRQPLNGMLKLLEWQRQQRSSCLSPLKPARKRALAPSKFTPFTGTTRSTHLLISGAFGTNFNNFFHPLSNHSCLSSPLLC